jgi:hypothetical protein
MLRVLSKEDSQMEILETLAKAIMNVAEKERLDLNTLKEQVPKQFWIKVLKELGGAHNSRGEPWTPKSLAAQWMRKKDDLVSVIKTQQQDVSADSDANEVSTAGTLSPDEPATAEQKEEQSPKIEEPTAGYPELDRRIRGLIQEELTKKQEDLLKSIEERLQQKHASTTFVNFTDSDVPPVPRRVRRKMKGEPPGHVSAMVDRTLSDLFEKDRYERFQGNAGRCLTWILWNFYGKPPLSFQDEDDVIK